MAVCVFVFVCECEWKNIVFVLAFGKLLFVA